MPATLAAKLAALVALVATPAVAQPPGGQTPGGLYPPPGYRPRTPPAPQPSRPTAPTAGALPGNSGVGGKIMYFQKPADALTATGADGEPAGVAMAAPERGPAPVVTIGAADVPAPALLPPPPPPSRYLPPEPTPAPAEPVAHRQPVEVPGGAGPVPVGPSTVFKQPGKIIPVDPKYIQLPPREHIFTVYNDLELEKAIMERLRQDLIEQQKKYSPEAERYLVFPPLPVVSPPGVPYRPKTFAYAPSKVIVEPGYVVHRRLHFEEKNAERAGWDLGPLSVVLGAGYFLRDALLWPQSLASGCVTGFWSTSAGKCLPGTPSPYYLYPLGLTVTGTAFETLVVATTAVIFP